MALIISRWRQQRHGNGWRNHGISGQYQSKEKQKSVFLLYIIRSKPFCLCYYVLLYNAFIVCDIHNIIPLVTL